MQLDAARPGTSTGAPTLINDDVIDLGYAPRKIRSCSSDAATTTEPVPIPRRISEPVCHSDQDAGSSSNGASASVTLTTRAIVTGCQSPGTPSPTLSTAAFRQKLFARRPMASLDEQRSRAGKATLSLQGSPDTSTEPWPTSVRKSRHTSLRIKRSLKSTKERSLSIDPLHVEKALKKL